MVDIPYIAEAAALIGDPARANMLSALKDDGILSATELAQVAGVAPNTASGHLLKLVDAKMIVVERKGRHRFFALACAEVADALEALEALAEKTTPRHRPKGPEDRDTRYARSCYDHLAGRLGVELAQALVRLEFIDQTARGFDLLDKGIDAFPKLGIDLDALKAKRRCLLRACPDWSEGRSHLGGALGAKLFEHFCESGWLRRRTGSRVVDLTPKGRSAFRQRFGVIR
jgi:DNA-binding transcriptional ArsR family regulator